MYICTLAYNTPTLFWFLYVSRLKDFMRSKVKQRCFPYLSLADITSNIWSQSSLLKCCGQMATTESWQKDVWCIWRKTYSTHSPILAFLVLVIFSLDWFGLPSYLSCTICLPTVLLTSAMSALCCIVTVGRDYWLKNHGTSLKYMALFSACKCCSPSYTSCWTKLIEDVKSQKITCLSRLTCSGLIYWRGIISEGK